MNDTMSLLLATTILATGGVCLYMYKNTDNEEETGDTEYNENNLFGGLGNFFGSTEDEATNSDNNNDNETHSEEDDLDFYEPKPKQRGGAGKTKRNRRTGGTKRRY
jgi:hypothetical protein